MVLSMVLAGNTGPDCSGDLTKPVPTPTPTADACSAITPEQKPAQSRIFAANYTLWKVRDIEVCWEDSSYRANQEIERETVRDAVESSWQYAFDVENVPAQYRFRFVGWTRCSEGNNRGIRIYVNDQRPGTKGLGDQIAGVQNGMVLNFTFKLWNTYCSNEDVRLLCVGPVAVHEFGHAVGLAHENDRPDTPEWCDEPPSSSGDTVLGEWDVFSVMNYCNSIWNNNGVLSDNDLFYFRKLYYPEWDAAGCLPPL